MKTCQACVLHLTLEPRNEDVVLETTCIEGGQGVVPQRTVKTQRGDWMQVLGRQKRAVPLQKLRNRNQGGEGFALRKENSDLDSRANTRVNSRKETRQACELSAASLGFSLGLWCHTCVCHALEKMRGAFNPVSSAGLLKSACRSLEGSAQGSAME